MQSLLVNQVFCVFHVLNTTFKLHYAADLLDPIIMFDLMSVYYEVKTFTLPALAQHDQFRLQPIPPGFI